MIDFKEYESLVKIVFGTPDGEKLLKELVKHNVNNSLYSESPNTTYYRIGRRDMVLEIMQLLNSRNDDVTFAYLTGENDDE